MYNRGKVDQQIPDKTRGSGYDLWKRKVRISSNMIVFSNQYGVEEIQKTKI